MKIVSVVMCSLLTITRHVSGQNCQSKGFKGCECNILGACDQYGSPIAGLDDKFTGYAPIGVEQFHYAKSPQDLPNLAYLCESKTVTIMYDCNARIPLYAATMVTNDQLHGIYDRGDNKFKQSQLLDPKFQQGPADYKHSNVRQACYENVAKEYLTEQSWYQQKNGDVGKIKCSENSPDILILAPMSKGHMIASRYGKAEPDRTKATHIFTNVVPQFESFNNNEWKEREHYLIDEWGPKSCGSSEHSEAKLFIVVGAIPSTFKDTTNPRFFGKSGFSNFAGKSQLSDTYAKGIGGNEYRANVPKYMWTAACCTFQYLDDQKQPKDGIKSIAFYRSNDPGKTTCTTTTPAKMMMDFKKIWPGMADIQPFPKNPSCMTASP